MKFAIVDDSTEFIQAVKKLWDGMENSCEGDTPEFIHYNQRDSFSELVTKLNGQDEVLLDVSLFGEDEIRQLTESLPDTRLWMLTGKADSEEIESWLGWSKKYPKVQTEWFEKPIQIEQVLHTLKKQNPAASEKESACHAGLEDIPVPCRGFDKDMVAVRNNRFWRIALDAFPSHFNSTDLETLRSGQAVTLDTWSKLPDAPGKFGKVRYVTQPWRGGYLQLGLPLPETRNDSVAQAVSDIFKLMLGGGAFTRARFFKIVPVSGSSGLLRLCQSSHDVSVSLPYALPIGALLSRHNAEFEEKIDLMVQQGKSHELVYAIRDKSDEAGNQDSDILQWNSILRAGDEPWLVLPVFPEKKKKVVALMVFDRVNRAKDADDASGCDITDELVKSLEPRLLGAIQHLREVGSQEETVKQLEFSKALSRWRNKFVETVDQPADTHALSALDKQVLGAATELTGADSALLALHPAAANYLEVRTYTDAKMAGLRLSFDRKHFVAVQSALEGKPVFRPDCRGKPYPEDEVVKDDWRDALAYLPLAETDREERLEKLRNCPLIISLFIRPDGISQVGAESSATQAYSGHFPVGHLDALFVDGSVQCRVHRQPLSGGCAANEGEHDFQAP